MNNSTDGRPAFSTDHGARRASPDSITPQTPPSRLNRGIGPSIDSCGTWLVVPLGAPHVISGWPLVGGDVIGATRVAWRYARNAELPRELDPKAWLRSQMLLRFGRADMPCFLTARKLDHFQETCAKVDGVRVRAIATVGLSNALAAGDLPGDLLGRQIPLQGFSIGTINTLVICDRPLTAEARLEALSIATEAKTLALFEAGVMSRIARGKTRPATGTGTDCAVVAAPADRFRSGKGLAEAAGKHTALGAAIGAATFEAIDCGVRAWLDEMGSSR